MRTLILLSFFLAALVPVARASLIYHESISGDLSNFGSAPTPLLFTEGVNLITGTMGGSPDADPDIVTFTIQPGQWLTSIFLGTLNPLERSFYAIAAGPTINMNDGTTHLGNYLTFEIGELMDDLSTGGTFGGSGFAVPLGAGIYTAWIQEISTRVDYQLAYTVIPEPASTAAILVGLTAVGVLFLHKKLNRQCPG